MTDEVRKAWEELKAGPPTPEQEKFLQEVKEERASKEISQALDLAGPGITWDQRTGIIRSIRTKHGLTAFEGSRK